MRADKANAVMTIFDKKFSTELSADPGKVCKNLESLLNPLNDIFMIHVEPSVDTENKRYTYDMYLSIYLNRRSRAIGKVVSVKSVDDRLHVDIESQSDRMTVIFTIDRKVR